MTEINFAMAHLFLAFDDEWMEKPVLEKKKSHLLLSVRANHFTADRVFSVQKSPQSVSFLAGKGPGKDSR